MPDTILVAGSAGRTAGAAPAGQVSNPVQDRPQRPYMATQTTGAKRTPSDWRGRQIERADRAYAAPFRERMRAKYRACKTAGELLALAAECWRERDYAARQANRFADFTRHGSHQYDAWDYLAVDAESFAKQLEAKARAVRAEGRLSP